MRSCAEWLAVWMCVAVWLLACLLHELFDGLLQVVQATAHLIDCGTDHTAQHTRGKCESTESVVGTAQPVSISSQARRADSKSDGAAARSSQCPVAVR